MGGGILRRTPENIRPDNSNEVVWTQKLILVVQAGVWHPLARTPAHQQTTQRRTDTNETTATATDAESGRANALGRVASWALLWAAAEPFRLGLFEGGGEMSATYSDMKGQSVQSSWSMDWDLAP